MGRSGPWDGRASEADCIEAGDPFVTELARFDHAITDYTFHWHWLDLTAQEGWERATGVQRDLDAFEIATLRRWMGL
jgi:hypothetical protein